MVFFSNPTSYLVKEDKGVPNYDWQKVEALRGRMLQTLRGNAFDILNVTVDKVTVVPHSTGKARAVTASEIKAGLALITKVGVSGLTAAQVRAAGASEVNPVYVVAIVKAITQAASSHV